LHEFEGFAKVQSRKCVGEEGNTKRKPKINKDERIEAENKEGMRNNREIIGSNR